MRFRLVRPLRIELGLGVPETAINKSTGFSLPGTWREQFRFRCNEHGDEHKASGVKVLGE